jgi:hypothetical protein
VIFLPDDLERLARELANTTGEDLEIAVKHALEECLERLRPTTEAGRKDPGDAPDGPAAL